MIKSVCFKWIMVYSKPGNWISVFQVDMNSAAHKGNFLLITRIDELIKQRLGEFNKLFHIYSMCTMLHFYSMNYESDTIFGKFSILPNDIQLV